MLCTPGFWEDAYQALKEDALSGATTARRVLLFVAKGNCDAIATLQILEHVLNKDNVPYGIYPVANEAELVQRSEEMLRDDEERSIICIGCGASIDIRTTLSCSPGVRIYVFDSHRPLDRMNCEKTNSQVLIVCEDGDHVIAEEESDSDEDVPSSSSDDDEEDADEEDGGAGGGSGKRRRRNEEKGKALKKAKKAPPRDHALLASGCLAYEFASHLNKSDVGCLWKCIVSLTEHYLCQRVTHDDYMQRVVEYERKIAMMGAANTAVSSNSNSSLGRKRIQYREDFHLLLLQHWSLADALFNSPYVATRLRTWKESGREKLELMLAKMGFPLVECHQHFTHMSPKLKQRLSTKLQECAPQFGLVNCAFASFEKEDGLTSTDMVHAVNALLVQEGGFWGAYEALSSGKKKDGAVQKGIELAKGLQRVIVKVGGEVIGRNGMVVNCGSFRYAALGDTLQEEALSNPFILERLALFIQEGLLHGGRSDKPLVVAGPESGGKVQLVVVGPRNIFSKFKKAGFESNLIQIPHKDVSEFMDSLILNM